MRALQKKFTNYKIPQALIEKGLYSFYHAIESGQDTVVKMKGKEILMFGSNSYLGLTNHPELVKAASEAIQKYGTGASGSRLMNGNLDLHVELEEKLADFVNKPAATVFSTGFQTNLGVISSMVGRNDYIILDEKNHASIIEGSRLTFAKTLKYRHNDMDSLEKLLRKTDRDQTTLIVIDGVFSMEGDVARLDKICDLADEYGASVMVDDAHALGVIGENGSGTASHYGLTDRTDLIMGTFSKSLASLGGFIAGDFDTINYIKHNARSLLFSASIPPSAAATVLKALDVIKAEPNRLTNLWDNTDYARKCLTQEGFELGQSTTPILPIFIGDDINTYKYATWLLDNGVYVNPIVHPAVDKGRAILRFSLMATHTRAQIDFAVEKIVKCRELIDRKNVPEYIEASL